MSVKVYIIVIRDEDKIIKDVSNVFTDRMEAQLHMLNVKKLTGYKRCTMVTRHLIDHHHGEDLLAQ